MSPTAAEPVCAIGWEWPPARFALRSDDPDLLERGAALFRSASPLDPVPPQPADSLHSIVYSCRRSPTNGNRPPTPGWRVRLHGETREVAAESIGRALWEVEAHALQSLLRCPDALPGIHAALLVRGGSGLVLVGPYESGKSSLACALWQRGWSFPCDDAVLLDGEQLLAHPTPRRVSLRASSRALFGAELWARLRSTPSCVETAKGIMFHPREVDGRWEPRPVRLHAIVFLARQGTVTAPAELRRIEPAHALMALLPYSNARDRFGTRAALGQLRPITAAVGAYDLGRGPLEAMVERIEELFARGATDA